MSTVIKKRTPIIASNTLEFVLFDIGCGNATRGVQWATKDKRMHVFCFDPRKECIDQALIKSQDKYVKGRVHPFQLAVASPVQNTLSFYVANDASSSSLLEFNKEVVATKWKYPPGKTFFRTIAMEPVQTVRMDKFMNERRISRVLFCRIETQGTALDVLRSFGERIKDIYEFAIKVHVTDFDLYLEQTRKEDLLDFMNYYGFLVYGSNKYSQNQEEIIWFVNKKYAAKALHLDYSAS